MVRSHERTRIVRIGHDTYFHLIGIGCCSSTGINLHTELQTFNRINTESRECKIVIMTFRYLTQIKCYISGAFRTKVRVVSILSAKSGTIRQVTCTGSSITLEVFYIREGQLSTKGLERHFCAPLAYTTLFRTNGLCVNIQFCVVRQVRERLARRSFNDTVKDICRCRIRVRQRGGADFQVPFACFRCSPRDSSRSGVNVCSLNGQYLLTLRNQLNLDIIQIHVECCSARIGTTYRRTPICRIVDTERDATAMDIARKVHIEFLPLFRL